MEDRKERNEPWLSVPQFGDWDQKGQVPDYSMDFSKIREMRKQNKRDVSRASLGNEEELIAKNTRTDNSGHTNSHDHNFQQDHSPTVRIFFSYSIQFILRVLVRAYTLPNVVCLVLKFIRVGYMSPRVKLNNLLLYYSNYYLCPAKTTRKLVLADKQFVSAKFKFCRFSFWPTIFFVGNIVTKCELKGFFQKNYCFCARDFNQRYLADNVICW